MEGGDAYVCLSQFLRLARTVLGQPLVRQRFGLR